ncbi:ATP-binding protein [Streptomyces albospinus]|uniref:ATP-binding protein n=1 Tax=Streptomyces albospinus TaxID=285515 RepID=UPI00167044BD|nr:ATP-binding protein [Streptomyces albospinus]
MTEAWQCGEEPSIDITAFVENGREPGDRMVTEVVIGALLKAAASGALSSLSGKVTGATWEKLKRDPSKKAFQRALGRAIERYCETEQRLTLARPLLARRGPLSKDEVTAELGKVLRHDATPDPAVLAEHWRATMEEPVTADLNAEAGALLELLHTELRDEELFRPVFAQQSLDAIAEEAATSTGSLEQLVESLSNLTELADSHLAELTDTIRAARPALSAHVRSWTCLINERTQGFVGRAFVFEAFERFTQENTRGYFLVRAKPGLGKTAVAAELVRRTGHIHHFNVRAEGINRADMFLRSVCAQIIAAYSLPFTDLPPDTGRDAGFLSALLDQVSNRLRDGERCVIVVDGLDEADTSDHELANVLFLPTLLPRRTYIFATFREASPVQLRIDCEQLSLNIEASSEENLADIREYVRAAASRASAFITTERLTTDDFVNLLTDRSEGNFMFLRHVIPEVIHGRYDANQIPRGLENYYEDQWRLMRSSGKMEDYLPVLMALTAIDGPLTIRAISEFAGISDQFRIRTALDQWGQFLDKDKIELDQRAQTRYRIYHQSFRDFLRQKDEVGELAFTHQEALSRASDTLLNSLYGNE